MSNDQRPDHEARQETKVVELYASRDKIYPRSVSGIFATWRKLGVAILLGLFYGLCWVEIDGQQLVLFDLPARQFHLFGLTFWPQDFFYLTVLLIICALGLFFVTTLFGRVWCGYTCPQTVYTEVFLWVERLCEGDRGRQMKLDARPWDADKALRKGVKHAIWLVFSLWTGLTFVGYFTPIRELMPAVFSAGEVGGWELFWILFYGFATYGNAGWMREQVCLYMCPYARFQSAMFDKDTLIIGYDSKRGDPRGARKRGDDPAEAGLGSCVNCTLCVQVCPTGIDIRDGLQYECIGCAACIDVCDQVMERMDYPKGLISYTSERALSGDGKQRLSRPRVWAYGAVLGGLCLGLLVAVLNRAEVQLEVSRDRNALFRHTSTGLIENSYTLKVLNRDNRERRYALDVEGVDGVALLADTTITLAPGQSRTLVSTLQASPEALNNSIETVTFSLVDEDGEAALSRPARFIGPPPQ